MCFCTGSGELRAQSAPIAKGDKARMAGASRRDRGAHRQNRLALKSADTFAFRGPPSPHSHIANR